MIRTYVAVLGSVALAIGGCGAGGRPPANGPSKAQYIAKADRICAAAKSQARTYEDRLGSLPARARVKDTVASLQGELAVSVKAVAGLSALARPSADRATLDSYYAALDREIGALQKLVAAARTNDLAKVRQAGAANPALKADRTRIAERYGFKDCA